MRLKDASAEVLIQNALVAGGVGVAFDVSPTSTDWKVFSHLEEAKNDQVIFVFGTAGHLDARSMRTGETSEHYGIMVKVRGKDPEVSKLKILAVQKYLTEELKQTSMTNSGHVYLIHAVQMTSGIAPLGQEEKNARFAFTANFTATITQES